MLEELGAHVEEVTLPSLDYVRAANSVIMVSEAFAYHEPNLKTRPQDFGQIVRGRFRIGGLMSASDYLQAQRVRAWARRDFAEVMKTVDFLVTPTMAQPAPAFEGYEPNFDDAGEELHRTLQRPPAFRPFRCPAVSARAVCPLECKLPAKPLRRARRYPGRLYLPAVRRMARCEADNMNPWASVGKPEQTGWKREELGRIGYLDLGGGSQFQTSAVTVLKPGFESSNALGGDCGEAVRFRI